MWSPFLYFEEGLHFTLISVEPPSNHSFNPIRSSDRILHIYVSKVVALLYTVGPDERRDVMALDSRLLLTTRASLAPLRNVTSSNLNFNMQKQQQSQWCWSAVTTSTSLFYNVGSGWTQCTLVNAELNQTTCCQNGATSSCNQPWYLDKALQRTGNLKSVVGKAATYAGVQKEINANRALGVRIGWPDDTGHFVIIDGYSNTGGRFVSVKDPFYGPSTYSYNAFATGYQTTGKWTHSYYTH